MTNSHIAPDDGELYGDDAARIQRDREQEDKPEVTMKTYEVTCVKSFVAVVEAENEDEARKFAETEANDVQSQFGWDFTDINVREE